MNLKNSCIIILILMFIPINSFGKKMDLNKILRPYNLKIKNSKDYKVIYNYPSLFKNKTIHMIVADNKNIRLKLEIIRPCGIEYANRITASNMATIKNLYSDYTLPYSGTISVNTDCPKDKKAYALKINIHGKEYNSLVANASADYTFGVWDDSQIRTIGVLTFIYENSSQTLYKTTIFQPCSSYDMNNVITILKDFVKK